MRARGKALEHRRKKAGKKGKVNKAKEQSQTEQRKILPNLVKAHFTMSSPKPEPAQKQTKN